jgi:hypothetical protein
MDGLKANMTGLSRGSRDERAIQGTYRIITITGVFTKDHDS